MHDNTLTNENREKFSYVAGRYGQLVKFYNVEELYADKLNEFWRLIPAAKTSQFTPAAFYRLLIPQIFPADVDKAIYLDSDIIVNLDIAELWQIELGNKPLAAVPEVSNGTNTEYLELCRDGFVKPEDYFNSGVLLMNLKFLRDEESLITDGLKFVGEHPQLIYMDQEVLNYCFATQALRLPAKFNFFGNRVRKSNEFGLAKKIYHYLGRGLEMDMSNPFNALWMKYFIRSPWFSEESIGRLYSDVQRMHVALKNSMIEISAAMSGKTRVFFTTLNNLDALKRTFRIRDDEEIFLAENQSSLQKLFDAMNASRGQKVFFILLPNFPFKILTQAGFVRGKDFFNVVDFLSAAHGMPLNSYPLIQAM